MMHQPKGSMCMACTKRKDDCSGKDFASMPIIMKYPDGVKAVKCADFDRAKPPNMALFREGLAHARSFFQDITGQSYTMAYPDILENIESQASRRQGDFALGMTKFVADARDVLSGENAVATSKALR